MDDKNIDIRAGKNLNQWLTGISDIKILDNIRRLKKEDILNNFGHEFVNGTAGIRAKMGLGSCLFNVFTIRRWAEAYARYINWKYKNTKVKIIIVGHDSRYNSKEFAYEVAKILSKFNIYAFLNENNDPAPTPFFVSMIKRGNALGSIIVSASHNPAYYNGLKFYSHYSCQIADKEMKIITKTYNAISFNFLKNITLNTDYIKYLNSNDKQYYLVMFKHFPVRLGRYKTLIAVYTPFYGASTYFVPMLLNYTKINYAVVSEEAKLDPFFNNQIVLNPEDISIYKKGISLASKINADIVAATDPDGDRIGLCVSDIDKNNFALLSTNKIAIIILYYIIMQTSVDYKNRFFYTTYVSSNYFRKLFQEDYKLFRLVPTGPKNLAQAILKDSKESSKEMLFAYEESNGFIWNKLLLDKDGTQSIYIILAVLNYFKTKNLSANGVLEEIYKKYGYLQDGSFSISIDNRSTEESLKLREEIMKYYRSNIYDNFLDKKIQSKVDYLNDINIKQPTNLLKFYFEDEYNWIAVRPSGTEPKIKYYIHVVDKDKNIAYQKYVKIINRLKSSVKMFGL